MEIVKKNVNAYIKEIRMLRHKINTSSSIVHNKENSVTRDCAWYMSVRDGVKSCLILSLFQVRLSWHHGSNVKPVTCLNSCSWFIQC